MAWEAVGPEGDRLASEHFHHLALEDIHPLVEELRDPVSQALLLCQVHNQVWQEGRHY